MSCDYDCNEGLTYYTFMRFGLDWGLMNGFSSIFMPGFILLLMLLLLLFLLEE